MYLKSLREGDAAKLASGDNIKGNVLIDPSANVDESAVIGPDVVIGAGCKVGAGCRI